MIIEQALVEKLASIPSVRARVADRIYWGKRRHGDENRPLASDVPCIVIRRVNTMRDWSLDGPSSICTATFEIDSMDTEFANAAELADEIRSNLACFHETWGIILIQSVKIDGDRDLSADAVETEAANVCIRQQEVEIIYEET